MGGNRIEPGRLRKQIGLSPQWLSMRDKKSSSVLHVLGNKSMHCLDKIGGTHIPLEGNEIIFYAT
jgi:hypothetical protein